MKAFIICVIIISLGIFVNLPYPDEPHIFVEKSAPYVGAKIPHLDGIDGATIKIAVIDTGVDYTHHDLFGWGPDGKVIGGYNFVNPAMPPIDTNGHGTQVAGVIAADGNITGIAPKSKILAYKVSDDGEGVASDFIVQAINMAIDDGADIINISLGINKTNSHIEHAVNQAQDKGILVITAAGNDGPDFATIGSPGQNPDSLTVGATFNNLTTSLIATLHINDIPYAAIPMVGTPNTASPITGKIVFGGYGKAEDLENINAKDAILLVERGSDIPGQLLYFTIKESNAAAAGAKAVIVYNNEPGIFLGELTHEFATPGYMPQIPIISIDRKSGLLIRDSANQSSAELNLFYNPDHIAHYSSRGPVSPFYIKPDIVAPGTYINTTDINNTYNLTSGTSFAAPHASGAAALLLQSNPNLDNTALKSILLTTAVSVYDGYGNEFSLHESGTGRLDIKKAYNAKLIITPPNFVAIASPDSPNVTQNLHLDMINSSEIPSITFSGPKFIKFNHTIHDKMIQIQLSLTGSDFGEHEGRLHITHNDSQYTVPFLIHYTKSSITATLHNDQLHFKINHPDKWSFAKISILASDTGQKFTTSTTSVTSIKLPYNSEYWIHAKIKGQNQTYDAYDKIDITTINSTFYIDLPQRPIGIIGVMLAIIGSIGILPRLWVRR